MVAQRNCAVGAVISHGAHSHATNRGLELYQRVGVIVVIRRKGFTAGTEIGVITHSTLVANSSDVALRRLDLAERTITENAIVNFVLTSSFADSIVDLNKAMARVVLRGCQNALRAEVPVRTGQAFMTDANNALDKISIGVVRKWVGTYLVTAVADSSMAELAARKTARCDEVLQAEIAVGSEMESVTGVVAMFVPEKAAKAKVVVFAIVAAYEVALVCFCSLLTRGPRENASERLTTTASVANWLVFALNGGIQAGR